MSLNDFYIIGIQAKKKGNMDIYNKLLNDMFGKVLSWSEVKELSRDNQMKLMLELKRRIQINESKYDIKKLTRAIQNSRSGIGGSAITQFECAFCGEKESWGSTAVPRICKNCAEKMATNIVLYNMNIEKNSI
jgi:hypothetical protein